MRDTQLMPSGLLIQSHITLCRTQSAVDVPFWTELGDLKLNTWRLSEEPVNLQGTTVRKKFQYVVHAFTLRSCIARPQARAARHMGRACLRLFSWSERLSRVQPMRQFKRQDDTSCYICNHLAMLAGT